MPNRDQILQTYAEEGAQAAANQAGVSKRTVQRWAANAGIASGYQTPILRDCPSAASYVRGCRCQGCIDENRKTQREIKDRRVARYKQGQTKIKHGVSGYSNWECRCGVCRSAWSSYLRGRRSTSDSVDTV